MPDLPTLTVTQAQADRCLAAYGTVENYRAWLRAQVRRYVLTSESADAARVTQDVRAAMLGGTVDDPLPEG